ncbi:MAG: SMP-30/gluconolactonase/LRE family protein [Pseudomonadota bacterium]
MFIEVRDARLAKVVDVEAQVETLAEDFVFTEGPVWRAADASVIFSDIPASQLFRWREGEGVTVYRADSHMANGNALDHGGRLLSCEHGTSRVVREHSDTTEVLASHYEGKALNSPNDIVVRSDGAILFTDPTYGRQDNPTGLARDPELEFCGVYLIDGDGELILLNRSLEMPNGLCLSDDERSLYVADTAQRQVWRFALDGNRLGEGRVVCRSPAPDGLKLDASGFLYAGGVGGVSVYDPDDGAWLGRINTPGFCANFCWGGAELTTLYMTASEGLYRVRVRIPGRPLPPGYARDPLATVGQ